MPAAASTRPRTCHRGLRQDRSCGRPCRATQDEDADETQDEPAEDEPAEDPRASTRTTTAPPSRRPPREPTPETFDNHGQYVRSVATDNHGQDPAAERGKSQERGAKPNR